MIEAGNGLRPILTTTGAWPERFLKAVLAEVMDRCPRDLEFFQQALDNTLLATLANVVEKRFRAPAYTEACGILEEAAAKARRGVSGELGTDLQSEHERHLTEEVFRKPVVVTDYPTQIKAFYMRLTTMAARWRPMDVLVARIGEIIGGQPARGAPGRPAPAAWLGKG